MEKKKMIEELAKTICSCASPCDLEDWYDCEKMANCPKVIKIAKELHKDGYRKLDDHAIFVLRKAKSLEEKVRNETAREILQWLVAHTTENAVLRTYFREQFGVEVEE